MTDRQDPRECKHFKRAPWWNIFKDSHDCYLPRKVDNNGGEPGICIWSDCMQCCPDFTPKEKKK